MILAASSMEVEELPRCECARGLPVGGTIWLLFIQDSHASIAECDRRCGRSFVLNGAQLAGVRRHLEGALRVLRHAAARVAEQPAAAAGLTREAASR